MMPAKNASAIESRISAVRLLLQTQAARLVSGNLIRHFTTGGVSNVWNGGGEAMSIRDLHRPNATDLPHALGPPRMHLMIT
jgi:hypothetical protein